MLAIIALQSIIALLLLLFSCSVLSNSFWLHLFLQASLPCPSLSPGVCSCPLSQWCHPTISSSVTLFSSCPQYFPVSGSFCNEWALGIRWPKYWSFSFSISPSNEYSGLISFRIDYLISLLSTGLSRIFSSPTVQKHQVFSAQPSLWSNSHICTWLLEKTIALTIQTFVSKYLCQLYLCFIIHCLGLP